MLKKLPSSLGTLCISASIGCTAWYFSINTTNGVAQSTPVEPASTKSAPTISVSVQRVAIDIVVKDSAGNPVTGLMKDDFRITEDSKQQSLRSFDAYAPAALAAQVRTSNNLPQLPPNTFSDFSAVTQSGPLTVVLFDLLNTPLDAQPNSRAQLLEFLNKRPRTAPVAIFVLTDAIHLLQGFTDDDSALKTALSRQSDYKSTELLTGSDASTPTALASASGFDSLAAAQSATAQAQQQAIRGSGGRTGSSGGQKAADLADPEEEVEKLFQHELAFQSSAFLDRRVEITAGALNDIAGFLLSLPGRKNLIWLSGSFPAGVLPNPQDDINYQVGNVDKSDPQLTVDKIPFRDYEMVRNYTGAIREATNAMNDSHTAVYPVDARALQASGTYSAAIAPVLLGRGQSARSVNTGGQVLDAYHSLTLRAAEQTTMDTIASDTGGHAFYNTNGLAEAAAKAIDDGSTYYAITYQPTNSKTDGKLRTIKVECLKRGYTLEYRRFYFADSGPAKSGTKAQAADPMLVALRRGAPPAHSLFFEAHLQTLGDPAPATPQELEELRQFQPRDAHAKPPALPASAKSVMMQRYAITYGLLARQLDFAPGSDNQRHANLEFAAMAYDRDGNLLKGIRTRIDDTITPARYDKLQQNGYQTIQRVGIPANTTTLRIGVRDAATKLIGSTEIHLPLATER